MSAFHGLSSRQLPARPPLPKCLYAPIVVGPVYPIFPTKIVENWREYVPRLWGGGICEEKATRERSVGRVERWAVGRVDDEGHVGWGCRPLDLPGRLSMPGLAFIPSQPLHSFPSRGPFCLALPLPRCCCCCTEAREHTRPGRNQSQVPSLVPLL